MLVADERGRGDDPTQALPLFAKLHFDRSMYIVTRAQSRRRVRDLNGFGVVDSVSAIGREYDQRYLRPGARLLF
jgi:hypothetical protein